jgi:hypothetical protein
MAALAISLGVAGCLCGCKDTPPDADLLTQGGQAAAVVRSYYEALQQTVLDSWEFETAFSSLTGVAFGESEQTGYANRIAALAARATVAQRLEDVYSAAMQLRSGSDAQATAAAEGLGNALKAVPKYPSSGIDPSAVLGQATDALLGFLRNRSLANSNRVLTSLLEGIRTLFTDEAAAYQSILSEREQSGQHLLEILERQKMVTATPPLHDLAARLGVSWNDAGTAQPQAEALALALTTVQEKRAELLDACATTETGILLGELAARHQDLVAGRGVNLDNLRRTTAAANTCLQQRVQIPKQPND